MEKYIHRGHSASLVMPKRDPRDGIFYPTLTLLIASYTNPRVAHISQHIYNAETTSYQRLCNLIASHRQ